ncbi:radical SAM/SPASM domain-containing protein [Butyrivibrio sp. INlla16]|uniref:radical SAM/SPASM domain-containing protein n=1 Tax=Butyrivibrio sp. INlla16 TaxID=1520807 RepID=UPI000882826C|nr:radical SAM protein [Butyrivibrio sp. INlla16]SDB60240.1 Radical SAM superfamily enzyme, MoaA/NifB/PqqE/SkfB family [Butyrivibrio sp. INlla16]
MGDEKLNERESKKRNSLKEKKPYVYEKIQKFEEKFKRGESIAIIQMQYNYACNFHCTHCSIKRFRGVNSNRQMDPDAVRELARQADELGLARFVITGGEPLVFPDFDEVVKAIDPQKFYINVDTNGWFLDVERAKHLKEIGVDRVQLSIDNLEEAGHDAFRAYEGSFAKTMRAVDACQEVGLDIFIQTVVTKQRLHSEEFIKFIEYFNGRGIGVFVSFAKPVGAWEGQYDIMIDDDDLKFFNTLEKKYHVYSHLTPGYGLEMGCIAVKGMFSVTQYGDVLPCPYIHISIGNIFNEPLKDIIERGFSIKYFGEHIDVCTIAQDKDFICNYVEKCIYNHELPVNSDDVFGPEAATKVPFQDYKKES